MRAHDAELLARVVAGDHEAFNELMRIHEDRVFSVCLRILGNRESALDATQETFLAALRAYPRARPDSDLRAWVMTIARRKAIDHFRARARRPEPREDLPEQTARDANPGEREFDPELWAAVAELPSKQRDAVGLRFAADLAYAEIAAAMDTSEEAARRNVHEGLKKLREVVPTGKEER